GGGGGGGGRGGGRPAERRGVATELDKPGVGADASFVEPVHDRVLVVSWIVVGAALPENEPVPSNEDASADDEVADVESTHEEDGSFVDNEFDGIWFPLTADVVVKWVSAVADVEEAVVSAGSNVDGMTVLVTEIRDVAVAAIIDVVVVDVVGLAGGASSDDGMEEDPVEKQADVVSAVVSASVSDREAVDAVTGVVVPGPLPPDGLLNDVAIPAPSGVALVGLSAIGVGEVLTDVVRSVLTNDELVNTELVGGSGKVVSSALVTADTADESTEASIDDGVASLPEVASVVLIDAVGALAVCAVSVKVAGASDGFVVHGEFVAADVGTATECEGLAVAEETGDDDEDDVRDAVPMLSLVADVGMGPRLLSVDRIDAVSVDCAESVSTDGSGVSDGRCIHWGGRRLVRHALWGRGRHIMRCYHRLHLRRRGGSCRGGDGVGRPAGLRRCRRSRARLHRHRTRVDKSTGCHAAGRRCRCRRRCRRRVGDIKCHGHSHHDEGRRRRSIRFLGVRPHDGVANAATAAAGDTQSCRYVCGGRQHRRFDRGGGIRDRTQLGYRGESWGRSFDPCRDGHGFGGVGRRRQRSWRDRAVGGDFARSEGQGGGRTSRELWQTVQDLNRKALIAVLQIQPGVIPARGVIDRDKAPSIEVRGGAIALHVDELRPQCAPHQKVGVFSHLARIIVVPLEPPVALDRRPFLKQPGRGQMMLPSFPWMRSNAIELGHTQWVKSYRSLSDRFHQDR
ncbi:hypothetical protein CAUPRSCDRAFT_11359, partial [Caulochytrium protostelioides]